MVGRSRHRETRDGGRLASHRVSSLLALALPNWHRSAQSGRGDQGRDPPHGCRECRLGRTENPRRTAEARIRRLGTDRRLGICGACGAEAIQQNAGLLSSTTIARQSSRLTSSPFPRSRFSCFTASSSSSTVAVAVLHFNVTARPTSAWVVQQLRMTFPEVGPYRYAILDRDAKFDAEVIQFLKSTGLTPKHTSVQSPWQNGVAERWIGSCRPGVCNYAIWPIC